jgi:hypothetical protein
MTAGLLSRMAPWVREIPTGSLPGRTRTPVLAPQPETRPRRHARQQPIQSSGDSAQRTDTRKSPRLPSKGAPGRAPAISARRSAPNPSRRELRRFVMRRVTLGIFFCLRRLRRYRHGQAVLPGSMPGRIDRPSSWAVLRMTSSPLHGEGEHRGHRHLPQRVGRGGRPRKPQEARSPSRTWPASAGSLPSASPRARRMPAPAATGRRPASARAATGSSLNPSRCQ